MAKRRKRGKPAARAKAARSKAKRRPTPKKKKTKASPKRAARKTRAHASGKSKVRTETKTAWKAKADLRQRLRLRRAELSSDAQRVAAERMAANLTSTRFFLASRRIACYLPNDGEIDPSGVIERLWRMRKEVYLPIVPASSSERLRFARVLPGMELVSNRYGIPEPRASARDLTKAEDLDLVLLPLVAFDERGNRLGRGAGFYDKTLAFLHRRQHLRKPRLLGLAHDFQRMAAVPTDDWDVPLDGVVTDRAVYYTD